MTLDLVFRNTTKVRGFSAAFFRRALGATMRELRLGSRIETSVTLVGPDRMRTLNRTYRKKDAPTDVLSFPLGPSLGKRKWPTVLPKGNAGIGIDSITGLRIIDGNKIVHRRFPSEGLGDNVAKDYTDGALGDIFICPAHARKKAKAYGMPLRDYTAWLTVHGFLHLAGYDHERSRREAETMFALEEKVLKILKMVRPVV